MVWPLENSPGVNQLLARLLSANMNVTTDQAFTWAISGGGPNTGIFRYVVERVLVVNASTSLTTAAGGIYDTASKGGIAIVAAAQAYSGLTSSTLGIDLTVAAAGKAILTNAPILSLTTGQGSAATADFYLFGRFLPAPTS
jgi:hypothetical protein